MRSESSHRAKWYWHISELSLLGIEAALTPIPAATTRLARDGPARSSASSTRYGGWTGGPGDKIAKTTPCKVEWARLAAVVLRCVRARTEKCYIIRGPNLISSRFR